MGISLSPPSLMTHILTFSSISLGLSSTFLVLIRSSEIRLVCAFSGLKRDPHGPLRLSIFGDVRSGDSLSALPVGLWLCAVLNCFFVGFESLFLDCSTMMDSSVHISAWKIKIYILKKCSSSPWVLE